MWVHEFFYIFLFSLQAPETTQVSASNWLMDLGYGKGLMRGSCIFSPVLAVACSAIKAMVAKTQGLTISCYEHPVLPAVKSAEIGAGCLGVRVLKGFYLS